MIYLIHFDKPYYHVQHYIGFVERKANLPLRLQHHRSGNGARVLDVIIQHGIDFQVVRTWKGDRLLERRLKNRKKARKLCPVCNPATWDKNGVLEDETQKIPF